MPSPPPAGALVSIIIPCWNGEQYVADAVESALAQTYPRIEVIVVDDGSTDQSADVLRTFGDRIRWESGPNRGACAARNRGAEIASGAFLQFLDADDVLYPQKVERCIAEARDPGVAPICGWETVGEDGGVTVQLPDPSGADALAYALAHQIQTAAPLHDRQWYRRVGGFLPDLPCAQERDLHIRMAAAGLWFTAINEPLIRVRKRSGSVSSNAHRVLLQHEGSFLRAREILDARGALTGDREAALARAFVNDARLLVRLGDRVAARRYAAQARAMHAQSGLDAFTRAQSRMLAQLVGPVVGEQIIQFAARGLQRLSAWTGGVSSDEPSLARSAHDGAHQTPVHRAGDARRLDQTID